jgi:hypothetical protein
VNVEVIQPAFEPLASAKVLDLAKLSQGNHRIEVGWLKGGCCPKLVYALISKGMIQNLEVEPCEEAEVAVPEEIVAVFAEARKRIKDPTDWKPIPVQDIAMIWDGYPTRWGTGACCFYLCVWHYCLFCCASGVCWIERRKPDVIM